jgi:hypothetical protein
MHDCVLVRCIDITLENVTLRMLGRQSEALK